MSLNSDFCRFILQVNQYIEDQTEHKLWNTSILPSDDTILEELCRPVSPLIEEQILAFCSAFQDHLLATGVSADKISLCQMALTARSSFEPDLITAKIQNMLGVLHRKQGEFDASITYHQLSKEMRHKLGDKKGVAASLNGLGNTYLSKGDYPMAKQCFEKSIVIKRELGDERGVIGGQNNLGYLAQVQGDLEKAELIYSDALQKARTLGYERIIPLLNLGLREVAELKTAA